VVGSTPIHSRLSFVLERALHGLIKPASMTPATAMGVDGQV
jgi:hypothetical protein